MHVTDYYSYDSYGNTTASRRLDYRVFTGSTADSAYPYIRTETAYTSDGNFTASTKDARGNTVTQVVNTNDGTLTSVTDPAGQTVNYSYDASKRVRKCRRLRMARPTRTPTPIKTTASRPWRTTPPAMLRT